MSQPGDVRLLQRVRWRLVAWSAGSTLVLLLVLGGILYLSVQRSLAATGTAQLERQAVSLRDFMVHDPHGGVGSGEGEHEDESPFGRPIFGGPASGTLSIVVDEEGGIAGAQPSNAEGLPVTDGVEAARTGVTDVRDATVNGTPARVLSTAIEIGSKTYVVQVAQDRSAEERTLTTLLVVLVAGGLVVIGAAAAVGFVYAGRALVPIRDSLRRQREFAADASHELRTPLSVVRGSVELLRRNAAQPVAGVGEALDDIEAEVGHLTSLVDDLLLLARTDSGAVELRREPVDLAEVAADAVGALRPAAGARGVDLRLHAAPASVRGDAQRLRQLIAILVDNALRHSSAGDTVSVAIRPGAHPAVTIEDEGPGIRPEDLPHLFDRFWRAADAPEGGTGLGLAIARWIAERHDGRIQAANRIGHSGAHFEVVLPAA